MASGSPEDFEFVYPPFEHPWDGFVDDIWSGQGQITEVRTMYYRDQSDPSEPGLTALVRACVLRKVDDRYVHDYAALSALLHPDFSQNQSGEPDFRRFVVGSVEAGCYRLSLGGLEPYEDLDDATVMLGVFGDQGLPFDLALHTVEEMSAAAHVIGGLSSEHPNLEELFGRYIPEFI